MAPKEARGHNRAYALCRAVPYLYVVHLCLELLQSALHQGQPGVALHPLRRCLQLADVLHEVMLPPLVITHAADHLQVSGRNMIDRSDGAMWPDMACAALHLPCLLCCLSTNVGVTSR